MSVDNSYSSCIVKLDFDIPMTKASYGDLWEARALLNSEKFHWMPYSPMSVSFSYRLKKKKKSLSFAHCPSDIYPSKFPAILVAQTFNN